MLILKMEYCVCFCCARMDETTVRRIFWNVLHGIGRNEGRGRRMRKTVRKIDRKSRPRQGRTKSRRAPALEWLWTAAGSTARATLTGNRRALIENHTGILEFTPERIRLAAPNGEITVVGDAMQLAEVRPRALIVEGRIEAVELPPEADHD